MKVWNEKLSRTSKNDECVGVFLSLAFIYGGSFDFMEKKVFVRASLRKKGKKRVKSPVMEYGCKGKNGWLFDPVCIFQLRIRSSFHVKIPYLCLFCPGFYCVTISRLVTVHTTCLRKKNILSC